MKKRFFTILFILACWTSYSDLTSGSLPAGQASATRPSMKESRQSRPVEKAAINFQRITVEPGDTLLSVTERMNEQQTSIEQVLKDFSILNPSADPNHLQIGSTYAFPYYDKKAN